MSLVVKHTVAKHTVENCIWAPMPSKRYIKRLRENMNGYVNQESKKKENSCNLDSE